MLKDFKDIENMLKNSTRFLYLKNTPYSVCDPYYTDRSGYIKNDYHEEYKKDMEEFERCNDEYAEEIQQDTLRYPLILEMLAKKKELAENPIIFDKEEEFYETDPHKLVNFDEHFTPFFEKESNDVFFRNLKDPIRLKWEEIPEQDRRQKIVHFEESIRTLKYDELQEYLDHYLISKDLVLLFLKYLHNFWPIRKFFNYIKPYVVGKSPPEIYFFFIEKVLVLSSSYKLLRNELVSSDEAYKFLKVADILKANLFKELSSCLESEDWYDVLDDFIDKYDLFEDCKYPGVSRFYKFRAISKILILLNLSVFNILPIENNEEFEKLRLKNKQLFLTFLWYLKDLYWKDYSSPLKVKKDIKTYFENEEEYNRLNNLISCYHFRVVAVKEYFFTHHNIILKEEVDRKLKNFDLEQEKKKQEEYRYNADFYILNKELQAYEKEKEKIYSRFRKLKKSDEEIKEAIDLTYKKHLKKQASLNKFLFKPRGSKSKSKLEDKCIIECYLEDNSIVTKSYDDIINETTELFILNLKSLQLYDELRKAHIEDEPKKFLETNIYKKIFKDKLIEPNIWNKFRDYCFIAIDRYPKEIKPISELYDYEKEFIIEFLSDIMCISGDSPKNRVLYKPIKGRRKKGLE